MATLISPIVLLFAIITIGYLIGRIKLYNISLDLSAILLIAVATGFLISKFTPQVISDTFQNSFSVFSKLGTALFVSAIGLNSGRDISTGFNKKNLVCFCIGALMIMVSIAAMHFIALLDKNFDRSLLLGILCGALTSTPGLSAVCENTQYISELATIGYGCSYIIGVLGAVFSVQLFSQNHTSLTTQTADKTEIKSNEIILPLAISIALGTIIGNINFPLLDFSLGTSGGILCTSIMTGFIISKSKKKINISSLSIYRNIGLMLFFVGTGLPAGIKLNMTYEIKWFIYGVILTIIPIICGYIISKYLFGFSTIKNVCIISGIMTSTPAIGVLIRRFKNDVDLASYSYTYIGALLTLLVIL